MNSRRRRLQTRRQKAHKIRSRKCRKHRIHTLSSKMKGGRLGFRLPPDAIIGIQQDPYSAIIQTDADGAEKMFEDREPYLL